MAQVLKVNGQAIYSLFDRDFVCLILAALFFRCSFAPVQFRFGAWLVPFLFSLVILHNSSRERSFHGKRSLYFKAWFAALFFWLLCASDILFIEPWLRLLLVIIAMIFSLFWTHFFVLSVFLVSRLRIAVWFVVPVVWTGLEYGREQYMCNGSSLFAIEHSQHECLTLIQIADIGGDSLVGAFVMWFGATFASLVYGYHRSRRQHIPRAEYLPLQWPCIASLLVLTVATVLYGDHRIALIDANDHDHADTACASIALLQGNYEHHSFNESPEYFIEMQEHYLSQSELHGQAADLVVWPEMSYNSPYQIFDDSFVPAEWRGYPADEIGQAITDRLRELSAPLTDLTEKISTPLLVGLLVVHFSNDSDGTEVSQLFNSCVLVDTVRGVKPLYHKVNLFPFAETNPFDVSFQSHISSLPSLVHGNNVVSFSLSDGGQGVKLSDRAVQVPVIGVVRIAPMICYDSTCSNFVRQAVLKLREERCEPDIILNISNDASPRFRANIDFHFATHVFRAVETRREYLVAANGGPSAHISSSGRVVMKGLIGGNETQMARVCPPLVAPYSFYLEHGDWFSICSWAVVIIASVLYLLHFSGISRPQRAMRSRR